MTILGTKLKQPIEELDYDITYDKFLTDTDELHPTLVPNIVITPSEAGGLVKGAVNVMPDRLKIWLMEGNTDQQYKVEVTVRTNEGRVRQDEFYIYVVEL